MGKQQKTPDRIQERVVLGALTRSQLPQGSQTRAARGPSLGGPQSKQTSAQDGEVHQPWGTGGGVWGAMELESAPDSGGRQRRGRNEEQMGKELESWCVETCHQYLREGHAS